MGSSPVTLLHTRLAIIDLDRRADQPFHDDECTLVFNGELYNFVELRKELEAVGQRFRTSSDTEVIVKAYRHWGLDCFDHFEGMWAIALLDETVGRLLLSRDRFGEKPLFLQRHGGSIFFASTVNALAALSGRKPTVDHEQVTRYLVNGYKALYKQDRTWFTDVAEIPAATVSVIDEVGCRTDFRYWQLRYSPVPMTPGEALESTRERLFDAVRLRLRSDVPIAFCLSGGVDSSTLAAIAAKQFGQRLHTFSIVDGDPRYNEADAIAATVSDLGCDHHEIQTSTDGFFERLDRLVTDRAAPVATLTYYVHSFLSEAIAECGYKVAISGTAADELFTGYYDHYGFWLAAMHGRPEFPQLLQDWRDGYGTAVRNPYLQDPLTFWRSPDERGHVFLNADLFASYLEVDFNEPFDEMRYSEDTLRNRMLNELFHEAVPVILKEDDANSMLFSVENRSPYLDRALAEFLYTVPGEHLVHDGFAKWLLRAAGEGLLHDGVRLDKRKRGFNASIDSLVDRSDAATVDRLLADGPIFDLVSRGSLERFLSNDMTDNSFSKFLFSFVSAQSFLESYAQWQP
jgi:asparagine synthase (glutamine-hydrolysing)